MSSYSLSERINVHAILFWTVAVPVYRVAVAIDRTCQALRTLLPHLLFALAIVAKALGLLAIVVGGAFLALTFWVVLAQLAGGLAIIAAFGFVTYPRSSKAVRK